MAKIPGAVFVFIGIGIFFLTAYAFQQQYAARVVFSVASALLIIYGVGSIAVEAMKKKKEKEAAKKNKYDYMPQARPGGLQPTPAQRQQMQHAQQRQPARQSAGVMGFCSVCGSVARADDNFCGKCGSRLR